MGYASDVIVFNVLRETTSLGPLSAKFVSLTVSTVVSFVGNRQWTYRERATGAPPGIIPLQGLIFVAVTVIGMLIQMAFLGFSHYILGFTSLLADNISGNLVGMVVATAFRFWGYRTLVFQRASPRGEQGVPEDADTAAGQVVTVPHARDATDIGDRS